MGNRQQVLTIHDMRLIQRLHWIGIGTRSLSRLLGVSHSTVQRWVRF